MTINLQRNIERIHDSIIHNTTQLIGLGTGHYGELWSGGAKLSTLQELGVSAAKSAQERSSQHKNNASQPRHLTTEEQVSIKQIACGSIHVIMLDFDGRCWSLGCGASGQLGLGADHLNVQDPTLIDVGDIGNELIESVSTGGWFSAFISRSGHLFTCGDIARTYDKNMHNDNWTQYVTRRVTTRENNALRSNVDTFVKTSSSSSSSSDAGTPSDSTTNTMQQHSELTCRFYRMGCGTHSLLVQDENTMQVYALGDNETGALGTGKHRNPHLMEVFHYQTTDPTRSETKALLNFPCKRLVGSKRFSLVLDYHGTLFASGNGRSDTFSRVTELLDRDIRLVDVCCTWNQFLGLDVCGKIHLGSVHPKGVSLMLLVPLDPVAQIGSGVLHFYAQTERNIIQLRESEKESNPLTHPTVNVLSFGEGLSMSSSRSFVQLTGCYDTTMLHLASLMSEPSVLSRNLHQFSSCQQMCDVTIRFSAGE